MGSICRIADTGVVVVGTVAGVQTKSSLEHSTALVRGQTKTQLGLCCDAAAAAWRPDAGRSPPSTATIPLPGHRAPAFHSTLLHL